MSGYEDFLLDDPPSEQATPQIASEIATTATASTTTANTQGVTLWECEEEDLDCDVKKSLLLSLLMVFSLFLFVLDFSEFDEFSFADVPTKKTTKKKLKSKDSTADTTTTTTTSADGADGAGYEEFSFDAAPPQKTVKKAATGSVALKKEIEKLKITLVEEQTKFSITEQAWSDCLEKWLLLFWL